MRALSRHLLRLCRFPLLSRPAATFPAMRGLALPKPVRLLSALPARSVTSPPGIVLAGSLDEINNLITGVQDPIILFCYASYQFPRKR